MYPPDSKGRLRILGWLGFKFLNGFYDLTEENGQKHAMPFSFHDMSYCQMYSSGSRKETNARLFSKLCGRIYTRYPDRQQHTDKIQDWLLCLTKWVRQARTNSILFSILTGTMQRCLPQLAATSRDIVVQCPSKDKKNESIRAYFVHDQSGREKRFPWASIMTSMGFYYDGLSRVHYSVFFFNVLPVGRKSIGAVPQTKLSTKVLGSSVREERRRLWPTTFSPFHVGEYQGEFDDQRATRSYSVHDCLITKRLLRTDALGHSVLVSGSWFEPNCH